MMRVKLWYIALTVLLLTVGGVGVVSGAEQKWDETARKVLALSRQMDGRSAEVQEHSSKDRATLEAQLESLRAEHARVEKARVEAETQLNTLSQNRALLADEYEKNMADMKTVEGAVNTALRQSSKRMGISPITSFSPERLTLIQGLLRQETLLGLDEIQQFTDILFDDIEETATVEKKKRAVVGSDGKVVDVDLYRAGGFFLGYELAGDGVFALPQGSGPPISLLSSSGTLRNQIDGWIGGQGDILPIDITRGNALRAMEQKRGLKEWFDAGGLLLYPILVAGCIGALVALFKGLHLFTQRRLPRAIRKKVFPMLKDRKLEEAKQLLHRLGRCPAARVIEASLAWSDQSLDVLDNILQEGYMRQLSSLERYLSIVGVLASIAPLLGLLGTVTGMIETFQAITIFGTGDPRMMSTGISEALITTQAGLGIAIPLLLVHHFLKRRIAYLLDDMEETGTAMVAFLGAGANESSH